MRNLWIVILLLPLFSMAQTFAVFPYESSRYFYFDKISASECCAHNLFKPYQIRWSEQDSLNNESFFYYGKSRFLQKVFNQDLVSIEKDGLAIKANLLWKLQKGQLESDTNNYYRNTRGFEIYGTLGEKIFFHTQFLETQARFRPYLDQFIDRNVVIPSESWWKPFGDGERDYSYGQGYISFLPVKWLRIDAGHGKNFVGSGYRSILLSDNSFSYPYLKFTVTKNRWQYTVMYSELYNFRVRYYFYHYSKHATFSLLSYSGENYEIGLFEGIVWKTSDYATYVNRFPALFFVPVPLLREAFIGFDSQNNALAGLSGRLNLLGNFVLYGQALIDNYVFSEKNDNFKNRTGWQLGIKSYDLFFDNFEHLRLSAFAEMNKVRPYTYTSDYLYQNYTHYNQALAHPAGSGFREVVAAADLRFYNLSFRYKYNYILQSAGSDTLNLGVNLNDIPAEHTYENLDIAAYWPQQLIIHNFEAALVINRKSAMQLYLGFDFRKELGYFVNETGEMFTYFGFRTIIGNLYYDF